MDSHNLDVEEKKIKMKNKMETSSYDRDHTDIPKLAFTRQDMFITDSAPEAEYDPDRRPFGVHHGHLKLTMADMQLLNFFWNPQEVNNPVMVVAGGAPGNHFAVILRLYPEIKELHIYDTNKFFIQKPGKSHYAEEFGGRIFLHDEFFTAKTAKDWAGRKDIFFTSDIRSVSHEDTTPAKYYEDIISDNRQQEEWVRIINPVAAMLKFKIPILKDEKMESISYKGMDGYVFRGVWSREKTTECRLVPIKTKEGKYAERIWDDKKFRGQNIFNNYFRRIENAYINPYTGDVNPILPGTLENDFDSLSTAFIIHDYLLKVGFENIEQKNIISMYEFIMKSLQDISNTNVGISDLRALGFRSTRQPNDEDLKDFMKWGINPYKDNEKLFEKRRIRQEPEKKVGGVKMNVEQKKNKPSIKRERGAPKAKRIGGVKMNK